MKPLHSTFKVAYDDACREDHEHGTVDLHEARSDEGAVILAIYRKPNVCQNGTGYAGPASCGLIGLRDRVSPARAAVGPASPHLPRSPVTPVPVAGLCAFADWPAMPRPRVPGDGRPRTGRAASEELRGHSPCPRLERRGAHPSSASVRRLIQPDNSLARVRAQREGEQARIIERRCTLMHANSPRTGRGNYPPAERPETDATEEIRVHLRASA